PATAIGRELLFEVAGRAIGADEVAQRGAAAGDGGREDFLRRLRQQHVAFPRNPACLAPRRDAGAEQAFGGVDVAYADDHALVHQEGLDRRGAPAAAFEQILAVELLRQRFRSQRSQQFMNLAGGLPQQATETAWIVEAQYAAAGDG